MNKDMRDEVIYGRRADSLRVFVSSQMRDDVLATERRVVVETINDSPMHHAWCWEDDAPAGALHSEAECLGYAASSDGLVLLLASELTAVTRAEYEAARQNGADRYVFLRTGVQLGADAKRFVEQEQRDRTITKNFANVSELRTSLTGALMSSAVRASREEGLRRRSVELGSTPPTNATIPSHPTSPRGQG